MSRPIPNPGTRTFNVPPSNGQAGIWAGGDDLLVCRQITNEAPGVKTFRFSAASGNRFVFHAGQFVTLAVPLSDGTVWRSFTIASSPLQDADIALTIKAQPEARATRWLHETLQPGMSLAGRAPAGAFRVEALPTRPLVLVSAGSGATPMAAIARWLADQKASLPVHYLHVGRNEADLLFQAEMTAHAAALQTWTLDWIVTRGAPKPSLRFGRPDAHAWRTLIPTLAEAEVFVCGPTAFMMDLEAAHRAVGGDPARFHQEGFGAAEAPATLSAVLHLDTASEAHRLRIEPSGKETLVRDGESLLDAALRLGVRIPNSCRKGICGTCFVRKISGEVAMMHQGGIEDEDIEDGGILACCSYPRTPVTLRV